MNGISTIIYLVYVGAVLGYMLIQLINEERMTLIRKSIFCVLVLNTTLVHASLLELAKTPIPLIQIFYFDLKMWILILGFVFLLMSAIFFMSEKNERFKQLIGLED